MKVRRFVIFTAAFALAGCAHYPENARLTHNDPQGGYRFKNLSDGPGNSDSLQIFMAFSGGGMRAAALSYGVLEEMARTEVEWEGQRRRLVDEVDYISSVSGGSFTAAYYALYGDGIFKDYERKFLDKNIQAALTWRLFSPINWIRMAAPNFTRSDMAAEYYDNHIFGGATFGDLLKRNRKPFLSLNATDMSAGSTFQFTQEQFDYLCSDLSTFSIGRAVAASAAFPVLLSPITIDNYGGSCDFVEPAWMSATNNYMRARGAIRAKELRSYQDSAKRPFLHLLDGGLSDNLGLRGPYEDIAAKGGFRNKVGDDLDPNIVKKMVIIVVNASFKKHRDWDHASRPPSAVRVAVALGAVPMNRYSRDTLELLKDGVSEWEWLWNDANRAAAESDDVLLNGAPHVKFYTIVIGFDQLENESERNYFESLPTAFKLSPDAVKRVEGVAGKLLNQSEGYQALLRDLESESKR